MEPSADRDFENRLEAMFADPPPAPDAEAFARAVERRLAGENRQRRLVLAGSSVGGLIAGLAVLAVSAAGRGGLSAIADSSWIAQAGPFVIAAAGAWALVELSAAMSRS